MTDDHDTYRGYQNALARRAMREHPDAAPVPVPARHLLPAPDGVDVHGVVAHWRMADGEWLFAQPGHVFGRSFSGSLDQVEQDALAMLAAVAWARR